MKFSAKCSQNLSNILVISLFYAADAICYFLVSSKFNSDVWGTCKFTITLVSIGGSIPAFAEYAVSNQSVKCVSGYETEASHVIDF